GVANHPLARHDPRERADDLGLAGDQGGVGGGHTHAATVAPSRRGRLAPGETPVHSSPSRTGDGRMRWLGAAVLAAAMAAAGATGAQSGSREIAFVANAEGGTVSLVDVAARKVLGEIDVNPAKVRQSQATPNYAQDTDISPDGRTLYVSRGYLGDVAAFDIATGKLKWRTAVDPARSDHMTR